MNKVRKKVKKIKGRYSRTRTPNLSGPTGIISDPGDVANTFCETLSAMSRGSNSLQFLKIKKSVERVPPYFEGAEEDYNMHFTLAEIRNALKHSSNTAAGVDQIYLEC